jgi:hypothetical protein
MNEPTLSNAAHVQDLPPVIAVERGDLLPKHHDEDVSVRFDWAAELARTRVQIATSTWHVKSLASGRSIGPSLWNIPR